jgi:hypothetical protein
MNINPTLVFEQFGFIKERTEGSHAAGTCPFCKKPGHFYVNITKDNRPFDCKKCGASGGFQKFLQTVVKESAGYKPQIAELAAKRGLSADTLSTMRVGWLNDVWVVPVFSADGETILNIKIYDGTSFKNTAGCNAAMYGLWTIPDEYETVYIAEGEWDALTMIEIMDDERALILGVPGAGTVFKPEIIDLMIGKSVYLLYDNDLAGKNGTAKTLSALSSVASEIRFLKWPETTGEGWDVRDVYVKDCQRDSVKTLQWIHDHCELTTAPEKGVQTPNIIGEHIPHTLVYNTFKKWFHLNDNLKYDQKATDIYDVIFGTVFANRIPGDPVWLYLIAPPGGFKTEPLLAMAGGKLIEIHESVTAPALISGQNNNGVDPSLIPQLNGRLLIIKDWTIILGLPEQERQEILSILRGAFDGVCGRTFGNGIRRNIKSTFGIIAATTPIIEQFTEETAAVGERFLSWRNWISEDYATRYLHIKQALANTAKEIEMRKEINTVTKRVLLSGYKTLPTCDESVKDRIIKMSQWIAVMRGTVSRDRYRRNVLHKPFTEVATRLSKELYKLLLGISIFKGQGSIRPDTMRIAKSVAWSSISTRYAETLKAFVGQDYLTAADVEKKVGLPEETIKVVLENMMMLGVLTKNKEMKWKITDKFLNLSKGAGLL